MAHGDYRLFDSFGQAVLVADEGRRCVYANPAALELTGLSASQLVGKPLRADMDGVDLGELVHQVQRGLDGHGPLGTTCELGLPGTRPVRLRTSVEAAGEHVVLMCEPVRLSAAAGEVGNALERLIERRTAQLSAKQRELEQLTLVASHDLRAPVRTLRIFLELLHKDHGEALPEEGREYLEFAGKAAERMGELVDGLLEHALLGRDRQLSEADTRALLDAVCDDLAPEIKAAGAVIHADGLPSLPAYRTELRMLLQNLVSNALKYRRPGVPPEILVRAQPDGDGYRFCVRDNGIGIDPAQASRVFELFQRLHTRKEYEGTGIGLAHCEKIVGMHGGRIWVEPAEGGGSAFCFTLRSPQPNQ